MDDGDDLPLDLLLCTWRHLREPLDKEDKDEDEEDEEDVEVDRFLLVVAEDNSISRCRGEGGGITTV